MIQQMRWGNLMQDSNEEKLLTTKDQRLRLLIWFRLARFYNQSIRLTNTHLKQWDMTMAQFDALNQIGWHQPITQQQLGEREEDNKGNITQLLNCIEGASLYRRGQ